MLAQSGKQESVALLCREIASRVPQAIWAWKRLGEGEGMLVRGGEGVRKVGMWRRGQWQCPVVCP